MKSIAKKIGVLNALPAFTGQGVYMHKTSLAAPVLPKELRQYEPVIESMIAALTDRASVCYITIDEKLVRNSSHRRGGAHVDHNWYEGVAAHGGGGHSGSGGGHGAAPVPSWRQGGHTASAPSWRDSSPSHSPSRGAHGAARMDEFNGGMLLASNYAACKVWTGDFQGEIGEGGCCANIDLSGLKEFVMPANEVFYLNPLGIHESLPIVGEVQRQLVRINFHPDYVLCNEGILV